MIVKYPISTEKSIKGIETENKLTFIVDRHATKSEIKQEIEALYNVTVVRINTVVSPSSEKRAIVKFAPDTPAIDVATKLGLM